MSRERPTSTPIERPASDDRGAGTDDELHAPSGGIAEVAAIASGLDAAGVRWAVLRPPSEVDGGHGPLEIDVLVDRDDLDRFEAVLAGRGATRHPAWGHGSHRFHFIGPSTDGRWLKIDAVTELAFGPWLELAVDAADEVLARRNPGPDGWSLAPDDLFWAMLLHVLFDPSAPRPEARELRRRQLAALSTRASTDGPIPAAIRRAAGRAAWLDEVVRAAADGDDRRLAALSPRIRRALLHDRRWDAARRIARTAAARRLRRVLAAARRPGLTVAILGPDGSGKSTLVAELPRLLPVDVRTAYLGIYGRPAPRTRGLGAIVRIARLWRAGVVARWHRASGRIVVFDRSALDALTQSGGAPSTRVRRWLLRHAVRDPDLVIVLDAPAAVLADRRPEHTETELTDQRDRYLALGNRLRGVVIVDAAPTAGAVAATVAAHVWRRYVARQARS